MVETLTNTYGPYAFGTIVLLAILWALRMVGTTIAPIARALAQAAESNRAAAQENRAAALANQATATVLKVVVDQAVAIGARS